MKERRDRGLCYYCDDKWALGHRCRTPKLFLLEGLKAEAEEEVFEDVQEELAIREEQTTNEEGALLGISLHAILGTPTPRTMRLWGILEN